MYSLDYPRNGITVGPEHPGSSSTCALTAENMDEDRRRAEREDPAKARRLAARAGEGPLWRDAAARILAPHQIETGHLIIIIKLKVRRWVLNRNRGNPFETDDDSIMAFAALQREFLEELFVRKPEHFDFEQYFVDRLQGWCERCPNRRWRRKKGVRPRGNTLIFACEKCAPKIKENPLPQAGDVRASAPSATLEP